MINNSERKIRSQIVDTMCLLKKKNMNLGTEGNISVKYENGFFITPSATNPEVMRETQIIFKEFDKVFKKEKQPSSEWRMHQYIYNQRTEINAIVHCHSIWSSIVSCLREKIPSFHYMVAEIGGEDVKCSKYATFGTEQIAHNIVDALEKRKGCLISNHGQLSIGKNLEDALNLSFAIEKLSKQYYHCLLTNKTKLLSKKQMAESVLKFKGYKDTKH